MRQGEAGDRQQHTGCMKEAEVQGCMSHLLCDLHGQQQPPEGCRFCYSCLDVTQQALSIFSCSGCCQQLLAEAPGVLNCHERCREGWPATAAAATAAACEPCLRLLGLCCVDA